MEGTMPNTICLCKDCGQLDYAQGKCTKCGSTNLVSANQDFLMGYGAHIQLMQSVYEQHYYPGDTPLQKK